MLFIPENRDDISKYFRHSFLKFKETGDTLFYISHVDHNIVKGTLEDGREFNLYLAAEEPYEVDYVLPHKSFFQFGPDAVMLQRIPARQYHRGLTQENTSLSYRTPDGGVKQLEVSFSTLKAFVTKQKFSTLSEACKQGSAKTNSVVLSPRMMFMCHHRHIFMDFTPIAQVFPETKKIKMLAPIFQEEVADFLKTTQESFSFTQGNGK